MTHLHNRQFTGIRVSVIERDGEKCVNCGMARIEHRLKYGRDITVDHIDGDHNNNDRNNLQTLCLKCHGQKDIVRRKDFLVPTMAKRVKNQNLHARVPEDFASEIEDYISESTLVETAADLIRQAVREFIDRHPARIKSNKS